MRTKENRTTTASQSKAAFFKAENSSGFFAPRGDLQTGQPNDQYENEAERMAQLTTSGNAADNRLREMRKENQPSGLTDLEESNMAIEGFSDATVEEKIRKNNGGGQQMDRETQTDMESRLGAEFSNVNIHAGQDAAYLNHIMGSKAFTNGNDIYFNRGKYNPETSDGKHLLAHELTHTIQQSGQVPSAIQFTLGDNRDLFADRFAGDPVLEACLDGERTLRQGSSGEAVAKIQQALIDAGFPLPQFGTDGSFGTETKNALKDFQRASSLVDDGILGPATMSALDGLYAMGDPVLPPGTPVTPPPGTAPTVTSQTIAIAPDNSADSRTTVGVGERVLFSSDIAGTWTASAGHIIGINNGATMVWEAPAVAASAVITLTTASGNQTFNFTVIAPDDLIMVVANHEPIAAGTAGACMIQNVTVTPLTVNFGRTQWLEVPGPATNVTGYFRRFPATELRHHPNRHYLPFDDMNTGLTDHAADHGELPPFSDGTFEWVIPNRYKIDGETDAQGRFFANTVQSFFMNADGSMMITKTTALVFRTLNNTVI